MTDEELMSAYARGDRAAFAALFQRWAPRLHGFFLRGLREPAAADDLLQTTFLKVHRARTTFKPLLRLRQWIYAIAANELREELRRRRRAPLASRERQEAEEEGTADPRHASPEQRHIASIVRAAIDRLPESQKTVLHLHRYEEMTFGEIAEVLGMTESAVKVRAFRAYERLRRELSGLAGEERAA